MYALVAEGSSKDAHSRNAATQNDAKLVFCKKRDSFFFDFSSPPELSSRIASPHISRANPTEAGSCTNAPNTSPCVAAALWFPLVPPPDDPISRREFSKAFSFAARTA